jgi:cytidine deaminase
VSELIEAARAARKRSKAPYSGFEVGAAVLGGSGRIYTGSNVEVSSYGLTICAERLAICVALHEGESVLSQIAIVAATEGPPGPCGACRQFMYDFAPDATVDMVNLEGIERTSSVRDLLPDAFGPGDLERFRVRQEQSNAE